MSFDDNPHSPGGEQYPPNPFAAPQSADEPARAVPTLYDGEKLNPWFSIWTKPRATIRQIVDTDPKRMTVAIAAMAGAANGITNLQNVASFLTEPAAIIGAVIGATAVGTVFGILFWLLVSWLVSVAACWLDGTATLQEIRAAYAWPQVLAIWSCPLSFILVGVALSGGVQDGIPTTPAAAITFMVVGVAQMAIGFWMLVVFCKCIGEVSGFSAWRGLGAMLLSGLLMAGLIFAIMIPIVAVIAVLGSLA